MGIFQDALQHALPASAKPQIMESENAHCRHIHQEHDVRKVQHILPRGKLLEIGGVCDVEVPGLGCSHREKWNLATYVPLLIIALLHLY